MDPSGHKIAGLLASFGEATTVPWHLPPHCMQLRFPVSRIDYVAAT